MPPKNRTGQTRTPKTRTPVALLDTPPLWLAGFMALAVVQARWLPLLPATQLAAWVGLPPGRPRLLAVALVLVALLVMAAAALEFRREGTSLVPREAPRRLLTRGPYAISRNPIYIADVMLLGAVVLWLDLAALALLPLFLWLIRRRFIAGEEALCAAAFGAEWHAYAERVPRWLGAVRAG